MATAETAMAVTSREDGALESRMTRKRSCPVWGGGAGKVPQSNSPTPYSTSCPVWGEGAGKVPDRQLADALLYRTSGLMSGDGKRSNATAPVLDSTEG